MGAFYGSVHVRTTDSEAVRRAADTVAKKHRLKWLLAPPMNGWTTLYPSGHGQDEQPTRMLATLLPGFDLLHVVLHEDDVFAYRVFRDGKLLDEHNSDPDYFGEASAADRDRQRGQPERFADLLGSGLPDVERLLHTSSGDAMAKLAEFAKSLDLPNAATSYEYLVGGETDGIDRFDEFVNIPDPAAERAAKKAQQAALKSLKKQLQAAGALLAESSGGKGKLFPPRPLVCPIGHTDFLMCWRRSGSEDHCDLMRASPADWRNPSVTGIQLDSRVHSLAGSRSGRYLAVLYPSGSFELWDFTASRLIAQVDNPSLGGAVGMFTPDDSLLLVRSKDQILALRTQGGSVAYRINVRGGAHLIAVHPSAPYSVVDANSQPRIVDLEQRKPLQRLLIGGKFDHGTNMATQIRWYLDAESDPAAKERLRERLDDALRSVGRLLNDWIGKEALCDLTFSADGRYLLTATDRGTRAYDWQAVLAAHDDMPEPVFAIQAKPVSYDLLPGYPNIVARATAVGYDPRHHRMLSTGIEGKVYSVDLNTGQQQTVLEVPGRPPISRMCLSADASVLALGFNPVHSMRGAPKTPWWLQFWRYPLPDSRG